MSEAEFRANLAQFIEDMKTNEPDMELDYAEEWVFWLELCIADGDLLPEAREWTP